MSWTADPGDLLRVRPGFDLRGFDHRGKPGWTGGKRDGRAHMAQRGEALADLQEKLYAHGRTGGDRSVLLVLQGMDTAGKGGVVRTVMGMVDPQGVHLTAFGAPTEEELEHDFLWRIQRALPQPGRIGVFDRSHYEDVLIARVAGLVPDEVWQDRYEQINVFEREVAAAGTTIVKVLLAVSYDEQASRLRRRLQRPDKHWKFHPSDIDGRIDWPAYREAHQDVLDRTNTDVAPWHVVPADRKWYARLAVTELLVTALQGLRLDWPDVDLDVSAELDRLDTTLRLDPNRPA